MKKKILKFFVNLKKITLITLKKNNYFFNFLLDFTIRSQSLTIFASPAPVFFWSGSGSWFFSQSAPALKKPKTPGSGR